MVKEFAARQGTALRSLAVIGGTLATGAAVIVGAAIAVVFAATVALVAVMTSALLGLAGLAQRTARARNRQPDVLEARHLGGHHWVAYGWNERG